MKKIIKTKIRHYSKEILKYLLLTGMVYVAASSPYFTLRLIQNISKIKKRPSKKKAINAFNYLKRRGLIEVEKEGHDIRIALTKKGKKRAGKYQIDDLKIKKPKRWDKKWRVVIFDIPNTSRLIRDIFRRKLKEWGFHCLQQSVWITPYYCQEEINLLREFLGANKKQVQILEVNKLENEHFFKKIFKL
jgi:DNA-binding transcriptional regulator PaaX